MTDGAVLGYDNRTGRRPGLLLRGLARGLPGVGRVQRQADPYAAAWHRRNLQELALPGQRWIVLGDSLSQGLGASSYDSGWVDQLLHRLPPDQRPRIINLSATGARVGDVLEQQLPAYRALPAHSGTPDLVTLLVGSNDLFGARRHRRRLPESFAAVLDLVPTGTVVATLPQPRAAARAANQRVELARARGAVRVVDLRTSGPSSWRGKLAADRFHPNDAGYAAIAGAFEPVVRVALGFPVPPGDAA